MSLLGLHYSSGKSHHRRFMKILLTNDDGIYAEGIYALYKELKKIGQVTVVAPESERSSVGHGITLSHPIWQKKVNRKGRFFGHAISGTPADCVKFAVGIILKAKPDIVVSGINLGPNEGCSVFYSGTVAGAREGALMNIPSFAVSLATFVNPDFSYASRISTRIIRHMARQKIPSHTLLNINVPNVKAARIKGVRLTKQCMVPIHGTFRKRFDPNLKDYYWLTGKVPLKRKNLTIDAYALSLNYVTVTPIRIDSTDYDFLKSFPNLPVT